MTFHGAGGWIVKESEFRIRAKTGDTTALTFAGIIKKVPVLNDINVVITIFYFTNLRGII